MRISKFKYALVLDVFVYVEANAKEEYVGEELVGLFTSFDAADVRRREFIEAHNKYPAIEELEL